MHFATVLTELVDKIMITEYKLFLCLLALFFDLVKIEIKCVSSFL